MSYLDKFKLASLVAAIGFNDGANKGFWRIQPRVPKRRSGAGRWIEMGAEIRALLKVNGKIQSVIGRSVGSDGTPDAVRVLFQGLGDQGIPDGIVVVPTRFLELVSAVIPEEALKKQGIETPDNFEPLDIAGEIPNYDDLERTEITPEDVRVANEGINSPEGKEQAAFKNSPEGKAIEAAENDAATDIAWSEPDENGVSSTTMPNGVKLSASESTYAVDDNNGVNVAFGVQSEDSKSGLEANKKSAEDIYNEDPDSLLATEEKAKELFGVTTPGWMARSSKDGKYKGIYRDLNKGEAYTVQDYSDDDELTRPFDVGGLAAIGDWDKPTGFDTEQEAIDYVADKINKNFAASEEKAILDDIAQLWNEATYGGGADLAKYENKKGNPSFITPSDVIGATKVYALDDIKEGDYFYDPKSTDILKATADPSWNADKTAVDVPAVDASGADRSVAVSNSKPAIEKINYKAPPAKPASEKSPTKVEDAEPSGNAPAMPDTAVKLPITDVKSGDELYTPNGTYLGKLASSTPTKDADNKSVMRLKYTDETGRSYNVPYPLDTKFNVVRLPEEAKPEDVTPEAPAAPEAPVTPTEAPVTPEVPAKPARKATEDMTTPEFIADLKAKMDKADASKGAVAGFFDEARAILDDPKLNATQKLSAVAAAFQDARTKPRPAGSFGGSQFETMRQIMSNLDKVGVPEASKDYEKTLVAVKPPMKQVSADDGLPIAPAAKSNEEMFDLDVEEVHDEEGNLLPDLNGKPIYHANAIFNAIINQNPNAKLKTDGGLVIERDKFTDHDGTDYNYEITLYPTFGGQIIETYKITDLDGNLVEEFQHSDYKDSIKGIYGKKNGVMVFRDQLLGRSIPGKKDPTRDTLRFFGKNKTLSDRMRFFRGKGSTNKDSKAIKVRSMEETFAYYLEGRDRVINEVSKDAKSANTRGSIAQSFVASFYEAFELGSKDLMRERLVQLLGRTADTAEARERLIATLKTEMTRRYKGTNLGSKIGLTVQNLDKWMSTEGVDLRNLTKIPFVSTDGTTPVQVGDKVRAYGNEDQVMVGVVTRLNKRTGSGGAYKDTIAIKFKGGEVVNIFAARNVEILHDEHPDADVPLDNYEPWIRGDDMRKIRLGDEPALNATYLGFTGGDSSDPDVADPNAGTPYLGSDGASGNSNPPSDNGTKAEDLTPGSAWHSEEGEYLGSVTEIVEVPAEDGGEPGIAVVYVDADGIEQAEVVDKGTVRLPK